MNHFPVHCRIVTPMYLGDEAADRMTKAMEQSGVDLSNKIIEAVIKQCAFSLSINIGLMFVPVIGQAIAGLMSVMQQILGAKYQKDTEEIIASTSEEIKQRAELSKQEVIRVGQAVYQEELPAARVLAMSGQPLEGFGSFVRSAVSKVGGAVRDAAGSVQKFGSKLGKEVADLEDKVKEQASKLEDQAKVIAKNPEAQLKFLTTLSPIGLARLGIKYTANVAVGAAKAIESTNIIKEGTLSKPLSQTREHVDENLYTAQRLTSPLTTVQEGTRLTAKHGGELTAKALETAGQKAAAEDVRKVAGYAQQYAWEMEKAATPTGAYNLMSGRESYLAAKEACEKMRRTAFVEIDRQRIEAIAKFKSPQGRAEMRKTTAKAMRNDPAFIAYMEQIRLIEEAEKAEYAKLLAQEKAALSVLAQNAQPSTNTGAGTTVGIAAAVAAAFALS